MTVEATLAEMRHEDNGEGLCRSCGQAVRPMTYCRNNARFQVIGLLARTRRVCRLEDWSKLDETKEAQEAIRVLRRQRLRQGTRHRHQAEMHRPPRGQDLYELPGLLVLPRTVRMRADEHVMRLVPEPLDKERSAMIQVWSCQAEDIYFELMSGCPRCGALFCSGDRDCDMPPDWHEEAAEARRNHPDADFEEVSRMLSDPGVVTYGLTEP